MIYLTLGEGIRQGVPLYSGIHDNKPPLLYIIAGVAGSLFWFKAILAIWHLITIFLFWKLATALFPKKDRLQKVSTVIFAILTTIPLLEGNIVNAELFMIGPIIAAFLILLTKKLNLKNIFFAGTLFSVATLFKVPAAFDLVAIIFLWIIVAKNLKIKNLKQIALNSLYLALGFLAPILATLIWYAARGALSEYIIAAFLQNVGYLSTWRPGDVAEPFLTRNAPVLLRAAIVASGFTILYWQRKKLSKQFIFITAWLALTLFAVTLSERPYPHYLIQSVAPISLLLAILFTQKSIEQSLAIIPLAVAFFVPVYFKFWYYPTSPYYLRFIKFATGQMSKETYLSSFGGNVLRNYKIANYIKRTDETNKLFVWGDGVAIYALSRRLPPIKYVADYHLREFSSKRETLAALNLQRPEIIVVLPGADPFPQLGSFLSNNYYVTVTVIESAEIWKRVSNYQP